MPMTLSKEQENPEGIFIDFAEFVKLYKSGNLIRLERCQDLKSKYPELFAKDYRNYPKKIFFTHRWDDKDDPDIRNWQIEAIYQYGIELGEENNLPACFWYDYCSLPQSPRTDFEQSQFDEGLKHVNLLCRSCINVPLISNLGPNRVESIDVMLKRGWILVELFISNHHELIDYPLFEGSFDYISDGKSTRLEWSSLIPDLMDTLPFDSTVLIRKWFDVKGITCTNGSDLDVLSYRLYEHIYSYVENKSSRSTQKIPYNKPVVMSCEEISKYWINRHGFSALFKDTYFEKAYVENDNEYIVTARYRPPLTCFDKWEKKTQKEISKLKINNKTGLSPMYPGVIFKVKKSCFRYFIKAELYVRENGI